MRPGSCWPGSGRCRCCARWTSSRCATTGLFERLPGVSRRMLTATLQRLAVHRLVDRREILPQRVDYSLTPAGEDLIVVVEALDRWAARVSAAAAPPAGSAERPA